MLWRRRSRRFATKQCLLAAGAFTGVEGMPMNMRERSSRQHEQHRRHLWAIVLAGGEGIRLRSLVRRACGEERPKQYVPLLESRTLLRQTVDRVAGLVPPERTVVVTL